jgi:SAM-dependent methyltransferase
MPEDLLTELGQLVRVHPWWKARARLALRLLQRIGISPTSSVLDAGCGWGVTLDSLEAAGYTATGLDISREALDRLDGPRRRLVLADLTKPLPAEAAAAFDAVLALDVIEHVDDDRAVVATLSNLVRPGGAVVVSVPALPALYSDFDRVQGHRRRYTPSSLEAAFEGTLLGPLRTFWWGAWMVPVLALHRRPAGMSGTSPVDVYRSYLRLPRQPVPAAMAFAFRLEEGAAIRGWCPTGTSLFAVARRKSAFD